MADIPELAPWTDELTLAVPTDVDAELLALADTLPLPKTAMPVSSRRLWGGKGAVRGLPPFAAPVVVDAVLLALVDGAHDAVVLAPATAPTLCEAAVALPDVLPLLTDVTPVVAATLPLADVMPVLAEVTPLLTEVTPVLAEVTPLPEELPLLPAVPAEP